MRWGVVGKRKKKKKKKNFAPRGILESRSVSDVESSSSSSSSYGDCVYIPCVENYYYPPASLGSFLARLLLALLKFFREPPPDTTVFRGVAARCAMIPRGLTQPCDLQHLLQVKTQPNN